MRSCGGRSVQQGRRDERPLCATAARARRSRRRPARGAGGTVVADAHEDAPVVRRHAREVLGSPCRPRSTPSPRRRASESPRVSMRLNGLADRGGRRGHARGPGLEGGHHRRGVARGRAEGGEARAGHERERHAVGAHEVGEAVVADANANAAGHDLAGVRGARATEGAGLDHVDGAAPCAERVNSTAPLGEAAGGAALAWRWPRDWRACDHAAGVDITRARDGAAGLRMDTKASCRPDRAPRWAHFVSSRSSSAEGARDMRGVPTKRCDTPPPT